MDYGKISATEIEKMDTNLPDDATGNRLVLTGRPAMNPKVYLGTPKWGRKEWLGRLYPKGTKDAQFLDHYVQHYNAIEFNATHYQLHPAETILKWALKAGTHDFKFCPKLINQISHYSGFQNTATITQSFLEQIAGLGKHLGPVFIQLSEKFSPIKREAVFDYLASLPSHPGFFLEVRHPDWFGQHGLKTELFGRLRHMKIGAVITDALPHREVLHMELTIPKVFIRFCCQGDHHSDLSRIDDWAKRIKCWQELGLEECYFFVHVMQDAFSPDITQYVAAQFNKICNAQLPEVKMLSLF